MTADAYRAHLARCLLVLMTLPLTAVYEPTGLPVWQMNLMCIHAFECVMEDKLG